MSEKVIGIMGGMGPEATAELYLRLIRANPAERDQDHPRVIIYSNPKVPDRTAGILGTGPDPYPELLGSGRLLEKAGVDFIIIPCNTAHYYHSRLAKDIGIPVLHMIQLTADRVGTRYPEVKRAGLLATDGTIKARLYHDAFEKAGIGILSPSSEDQKGVMGAIYEHIKTGDLKEGRRILLEKANKLMEEGAQAIVDGCTEVSIVLKKGDLRIPVVDPLQVLAEEAIRLAREE